jgi:hypothetical protein
MLELAQKEVFLTIKLDSWRPFCESDIFTSLLLKKEIRTTLVIPKSRYLHMYIYIYIYICVCVCVFVCVNIYMYIYMDIWIYSHHNYLKRR